MSQGRDSRGRRQRRKKSRQPSEQPRIIRFDDAMRNYMPPPPPEREYPPCGLSGEAIDNIYVAIADPDNGNPCRFDKVLERIAKHEELEEGQRLAYIGAGNFAVVQEVSANNRRKIEVVKKIPYEDSHQKNQWRKELSPGISRDYVPQPESLDSLYSHDELMNFPKLGAASGVSYMPRTN